MFKPEVREFKKLAKKKSLIAVSFSMPSDLETPVSAFLKLVRNEPCSYLLESAEQGERVGRYSIIGLKPDDVYIAHPKNVEHINRSGRSRQITGKSLIQVLEERMHSLHLANAEGLPDFCGGFMGYFSYENVQQFETITLSNKKGLNTPKGVFFLSKELLIFDHFRKTMTFVIITDTAEKKSSAALHAAACKKIKAYAQKLKKPLKLTPRKSARKKFGIQSNMTRKAFEQHVNKIKSYIRAGDCIQTVLSQRFEIEGEYDDFQIYRSLRSVNPSPYMFYFKYKALRLIGASPELLVKKEGRQAEVRPIAGTRPRGATPAQDLKLEAQLKASKKEMAEHLMLVDLGRNDLGRVCQYDTVKVDRFAHTERYSHVMHLVTDVCGKLKGGYSAFDLLKATFPAGTVSGAPKIRAMQIIDELEPDQRGPYAGCLGYFSFNRNMEMCITIRTLVMQGKKTYLQAGAGIVKDSNPAKEYQETVNKAQALITAIQKQNASL